MNCAIAKGKASQTVLSEYESKRLLSSYGIPVTRERLVSQREDVAPACNEIGFPLVMKGCAAEFTHKTEKALVRLDVRTHGEALDVFDQIAPIVSPFAGGAVLVQEMVKGSRELMAGLTRDTQFGPCVMFGLGGIFTEILKDVSFRLAPLSRRDAAEMTAEIKGARILEGIRGMAPVDRSALEDILIALGRMGVENPRIQEVDVNPLIIRDGLPVAVDALVVMDGP
jgi:acetyl-CoA synthetase (ADP-forming)